MIYIGLTWLAGGLLLHFLPSTAPGWSSWVILMVLILLSGIILFVGKKAIPTNLSAGDAPTTENTTTVTGNPSNNWIAPIILLLVIGLGGFFIWNSGMFSGFQGTKVSAVSKIEAAKIVPSTTTGPPVGCPDCVEIPYTSSGGRKFRLLWPEVPNLEPGDTIYLWGIEIKGLGGGPQSNSITPEKIKNGTTIALAEGYTMPHPLHGQIKKRR